MPATTMVVTAMSRRILCIGDYLLDAAVATVSRIGGLLHALEPEPQPDSVVQARPSEGPRPILGWR